MRIKMFSEQGHYTEVHNLAFDILMPQLSGSEWKVLSFVIRRTLGWGKKSEYLPYSQIKKGTGIKSNTTISDAMKTLVSPELFGSPILMVKGGTASGATSHTSSQYALNRNFSIALDAPQEDAFEESHGPENGPSNAENSGSKNGPCDGPENRPHGPKNEPFNGPENGPSTVQKMDTHKERRNNKENSTAVPNGSYDPESSAGHERKVSIESPLAMAIRRVCKKRTLVLSPNDHKDLVVVLRGLPEDTTLEMVEEFGRKLPGHWTGKSGACKIMQVLENWDAVRDLPEPSVTEHAGGSLISQHEAEIARQRAARREVAP